MSEMSKQPRALRAWYQNQVDGPAHERFWNGTNWTVRVRPCGTRDSRDEEHVPVPTPAPPPPHPSDVVSPTRRPAPQEREPRAPVAANDGPRFIGDAELGGVSLRRMFDAACYVVAGIAFIVIGADTNTTWGVVLGVGVILYGAKIALTLSSYWVSTGIYVVAFLAVVATFGVLGGG